MLPQLAALLTSLITVTEGVEEVMEEKKNLSSLAESETRIVGGTVVDPPHKYPFQVSSPLEVRDEEIIYYKSALMPQRHS